MRRALAFLLLLAAAGVALPAEDPYYSRFLAHFQSIKSLQADFAQRHDSSGDSEEGQGFVSLKRPGKMHWEYLRPERKQFFLDNRRLLCYQPDEKQLLIQTLDPEDLEESPLLFLLGGRKDIGKYFRAQETPANVQGTRRYLLTPTRSDCPFTRIVLVLAGNPPFIQEITLYETSGATQRFRFFNVRLNPTVGDETFRFTPPPGTEIIRDP